MNTAVLLCGDGSELELDQVRGIDVEVVADLCRHPDLIASAVGEADRLVLGLCKGEYSLAAMQAEAQRVGIDPLGVELITLNGQDERSLRLTLTARIARAETFAGSEPANAKICFPQRVSRRDLLRGPAHEYRAAPSIDSDLCAAASGCRACVDVCPQKALSVSSRRIEYDRAVCEPCGLCVTTCPTGATVNPATTPHQLKAEISALLDSSVGPTGTRAIVFTCSRGGPPELPSGWQVVTVPCTGMIQPGWMLAPLLMGAGAVAVRPCRESGCALRHDNRTKAAVDFSRVLLRSLGATDDRVSLEPSASIPASWPTVILDDPFGPLGAAEVMRALATASERSPMSDIPEHPASPTALVQLHPDACTSCSRCAEACPTGALESTNHGRRLVISFDAARCVACSQCTAACPELDRRAISLSRTVDFTALSAGRTTLIETESVLCESCGEPIAPAPMLERVASMIGPGQEAIKTAITSRCLSCRSRGF